MISCYLFGHIIKTVPSLAALLTIINDLLNPIHVPHSVFNNKSKWAIQLLGQGTLECSAPNGTLHEYKISTLFMP